jgi:hypothetical protein
VSNSLPLDYDIPTVTTRARRIFMRRCLCGVQQ